MSETATDGGTQSKSVRLAVLLVVMAVVVLAGAVVWAGGIDGVADLLGFGDRDTVAQIPPKPEIPAADLAEEPVPSEDEASAEGTETVEPTEEDQTGTSPQTASTGAALAAATAPTAAQTAMYREQLQSQVQLAKLAGGEISQLAIGKASTTPSHSSIPVTVSYKQGGSLSGTMALARTDGKWFFNSITASGRTPSGATPKRTIDAGVIRTIVDQQATAANQDLITRGLVQGGFATARVDGVTRGAGTATVNVTLQGGSLDRRAARFVMISKDDSGTKNWFVTRFELK